MSDVDPFDQLNVYNEISNAINYLRAEAYYEQLDLSFRLQVCNEELNNPGKCKELKARCLNIIETFSTDNENNFFLSLIRKIAFRLYPKSLKEINDKQDKTNGRWISNHRTQKEYHVDNCDFFIDLPIELRILETLWALRIGRKLDSELPASCYANRVAPVHHKNLFKLYFTQYKKWRDAGLNRAKKCLENGQSVALLSMDISRFFYNVETSWDEIKEKCNNNSIDLALTDILKAIHEQYLFVCKPIISDCGIAIDANRRDLLPIGLLSSRVLANWNLRCWDNEVQDKLNPVYYGRYVDDMLIVLSNPPTQCTEELQSLIDCLLVESKLVTKEESNGTNSDSEIYSLSNTPFKVKGSKLIGAFFDINHSWAGLTSFIESLQKHNSEFRFLPTDEQGRELENTAFDILMEGSINKFRSILAISENGSELSKFLSGEIISHRLSKSPLKQSIKEQLSRFWKGRNLFDFIRIWEKNFTLLFIKHEKKMLGDFWDQTEELISRLEHNNQEVTAKLKSDLREHRRIAFSNTISLEKLDKLDYWRSNQNIPSSAIDSAIKIRNAHFCRSQYIVWPFLQFSDFQGNLSQLSMEHVVEYLQSSNAIGNDYFRYIYNHEKQLQQILTNACLGRPNNTTMHEIGFTKNTGLPLPDKYSPIVITLPNQDIDFNKEIQVGIANLKVHHSNINAAYEPDSAPVLSQERWQTLSTLLNLASKEKCNLLVLPEVSIPWAWFPLMVSHSHRHKIGLIFGLEHLVIGIAGKKSVTNTVVATLPYIENGITQCAVIVRSKNHYSPDEVHEFSRLGFTTLSSDPKQYHLINWHGMTFTIFNCFELTDIEHRSIFRGKVDALFAVEWNRDTEYFSSIVESAARDLHCTIIQANTSNFGDSRIYTPFHERYQRNIIRVKGGDNTTLLKTTLDFSDQRNFQQKHYSPDDKRYKPTPAGFEYDRKPIDTITQDNGDNFEGDGEY
ncbi:MAG: hypothetical protein GX639_01560 [Fibrobacter sp.]|nr:hypothetical protein [Fibrobacter sp.]